MPKAEKVVEVTDETEIEATPILDAFNAASDKEEDEIKMLMIKAGATFKNVTRLFNQYMVDTGQSMSKEAKTEILDGNLEDAELGTEEGFGAAVAVIVAKGTNVNDKSAAGMVRAWAKKAEVECYAKPAGSGNARNPFVGNFHAALVKNPMMEEQGLKDVISALDEKDQVNPQRWFNQHNAIRKVANKIAESLVA